ncbi:hypothetical protein ACXHQ0_08455 [Vibrio antiquarius]|uniref:hypothetical protein n=1 Tax=Vibrio diabolicus TaxID=50719 RepID=UPI00211B17B9|nr:hypothetical protein [Vibrio diabolicus]MCG9231074.1 hypothetical protein [Vibrio diabolicus]MCG9571085.1 hypothetical protein [Vibrio diabolicus]MCG9591339.1 hypothetical protein [Vibrio diabolicus]
MSFLIVNSDLPMLLSCYECSFIHDDWYYLAANWDCLFFVAFKATRTVNTPQVVIVVTLTILSGTARLKWLEKTDISGILAGQYQH